jgi:hypothetical protein
MAVPPPPKPRKNLTNQLLKVANTALSAPLSFAPSPSVFAIRAEKKTRPSRSADYKRGYSAGYSAGSRKKCKRKS